MLLHGYERLVHLPWKRSRAELPHEVVNVARRGVRGVRREELRTRRVNMLNPLSRALLLLHLLLQLCGLPRSELRP